MKKIGSLFFALMSPALLASTETQKNPYGGTASLEPISKASSVKASQYRVPVSMPFAAFVMNDVRWEKKSGGRYRLRYDLPSELVGREIKVDLESTSITPAGYIEFRGTKASGSCFESTKRVLCLMKYTRDFPIDLTSVEEILKKKYSKEDEMLARLNVAKFFSNDPAGIVEIDLR